MKKFVKVIYILLCLALCLTPFVSMSFARTDVTLENRTLASLPELNKNGKINYEYLTELGSYFEDHFAFKNEMVLLNNRAMREGFNESAVDTIIYGTDDWLYYSSSLNDFLGTNLISEKEAKNIAHNLALVNAYAEGKGVQFVFTVAPNKNSLYPENMPEQYKVKANEQHNIDLIKPELEAYGVNYADLFDAFTKTDEVLYRKQDSHWNEKGAVLAYNTIMNALEKEHEDYSGVTLNRTHVSIGDLANSFYSYTAKPEWDYEYGYEPKMAIVNDAEDWTKMWIETENKEKNGSVLCFRDSFGITLSKYIAEEYGKGYFSRSAIYRVASLVDEYKPDTLIFEIVERNLPTLLEFDADDSNGFCPPVIEAPLCEDEFTAKEEKESLATAKADMSPTDSTYVRIYGSVDESVITEDSEFVVNVNGINYEAYSVNLKLDGKNGSGYLAYLPAPKAKGENGTDVKVYVRNGEIYSLIASESISVEE